MSAANCLDSKQELAANLTTDCLAGQSARKVSLPAGSFSFLLPLSLSLPFLFLFLFPSRALSFDGAKNSVGRAQIVKASRASFYDTAAALVRVPVLVQLTNGLEVGQQCPATSSIHLSSYLAPTKQ